MNFSIAGIIRRLLAPQHKLSMSPAKWRELCANLRERGNNRSQESGAFLLGRRDGDTARISDFVLYDDLDPNCLKTGIVRFDGRYFGALWDLCEKRGLSVVADIHVHPGRSDQSASDQNHPMISQAGHIALILPRFADEPVLVPDTGVYRYLGGKKWDRIAPSARAKFLHIGF